MFVIQYLNVSNSVNFLLFSAVTSGVCMFQKYLFGDLGGKMKN